MTSGNEKQHQRVVVEPAVEDETELRNNPSLEWAGLKNLDPTCDGLSEDYIFLPEIAEEFESGLCSKRMMKGSARWPPAKDLHVLRWWVKKFGQQDG